VAFAFDVRRSERIFWKRSVRRDLLGVETRRGKSVSRSLPTHTLARAHAVPRHKQTHVDDLMMSFLLSSTRLPTIFSLNSGSIFA